MFKQKYVLEVQREERVYQLMVPSDAPLGELHDALQVMRNTVVEQIKAIDEKEKGSKEPKEPEQPDEQPEGNDE